MPTMDGIESTKCISQFAKDKGLVVKIVGLTAFGSAEMNEKCL